MTVIAYVFSEIRTTKDVVRDICKKPRLLDLVTRNMVKLSQTLLKSAQEHSQHTVMILIGTN